MQRVELLDDLHGCVYRLGGQCEVHSSPVIRLLCQPPGFLLQTRPNQRVLQSDRVPIEVTQHGLVEAVVSTLRHAVQPTVEVTHQTLVHGVSPLLQRLAGDSTLAQIDAVVTGLALGEACTSALRE